MSGSESTTTTQSQSRPWDVAEPAVQSIIQRSKDLGADTSRFVPTQSDQTKRAIDQFTNYASGPTLLSRVGENVSQGARHGFNTSLGTLQSTADGSNLNGNPYLDGVLEQQGQRTADIVNRQLSGAGRFGGNAATTDALAQRIGEQQMAARMGNYDQERQRQLAAASGLYAGGFQGAQLAGSVDQSRLGQAGVLAQAGAAQDQHDAGVRMAPMNALQWENGMISPLAAQYGQQSGSSTQSTPANVGSMIAGGAMLGLGAMTGNPMLMASGAGSFGSGMSGGGASAPQSGGSMGSFQWPQWFDSSSTGSPLENKSYQNKANW